MDNFLLDLKRENYSSSYELAYKTINYLRQLISQMKWSQAKNVMEELKKEGKKLSVIQPSAYIVGNMVRRFLKIIREEYARLQGFSEEMASKESLHQMLTSERSTLSEDFQLNVKELKTTVMEVISEYIGEMEAAAHNISAQAIEHIHSNEVILTIGRSRTVEEFLKQAAKKRKFHVIVVEAAPNFEGHIQAQLLAEAGIEATVITDTAVFAVMSRVNKVIIGTQSILANGGLMAVCGANLVALAAQHHAVPFIVLAAMYKLTPIYYSDCTGHDASFNRLVSPEKILHHLTASDRRHEGIQVYNPTFDYVPPELVTLFISNIGGNAPSYMYRLISELYHPDDYEL